MYKEQGVVRAGRTFRKRRPKQDRVSASVFDHVVKGDARKGAVIAILPSFASIGSVRAYDRGMRPVLTP